MLENSEDGVTTIKKNFFSKLSNGDLGLARTYWLYGVFAGFVVNFTASQMTSLGLIIVLLLVYTAYEIPVIMGVWRAANKYKGLKLWAVLAKIAIILGAIMLISGLVAALGLLGQ